MSVDRSRHGFTRSSTSRVIKETCPSLLYHTTERVCTYLVPVRTTWYLPPRTLTTVKEIRADRGSGTPRTAISQAVRPRLSHLRSGDFKNIRKKFGGIGTGRDAPPHPPSRTMPDPLRPSRVR